MSVSVPETKPAINTETAIGRSISFRPGSLYRDAEAYGKKQGKNGGTELNPSQVVCRALERLFEAEGFSRPSQLSAESVSAAAELIALAEEIGLSAALETLRGKLRRASSSKSAA